MGDGVEVSWVGGDEMEVRRGERKWRGTMTSITVTYDEGECMCNEASFEMDGLRNKKRNRGGRVYVYQ